jgi:hypothetical protein
MHLIGITPALLLLLQVCVGWFNRMRPLLLRASAALSAHHLALYHGYQRLQDLHAHAQVLLAKAVPTPPRATHHKQRFADAALAAAKAAAKEAGGIAGTPSLIGRQVLQRPGSPKSFPTQSPAAALLAATRRRSSAGSTNTASGSSSKRAQRAAASALAPSKLPADVLSPPQQAQVILVKVAEAVGMLARVLCALRDADGIAGLQAFCRKAFDPLVRLQCSASGRSARQAEGDWWAWLTAVQLQAAGRYEEALQQYASLLTSSNKAAVASEVVGDLAAQAYAAVGSWEKLDGWLHGAVGSKASLPVSLTLRALASWEERDAQTSEQRVHDVDSSAYSGAGGSLTADLLALKGLLAAADQKQVHPECLVEWAGCLVLSCCHALLPSCACQKVAELVSHVFLFSICVMQAMVLLGAATQQLSALSIGSPEACSGPQVLAAISVLASLKQQPTSGTSSQDAAEIFATSAAPWVAAKQARESTGDVLPLLRLLRRGSNAPASMQYARQYLLQHTAQIAQDGRSLDLAGRLLKDAAACTPKEAAEANTQGLSLKLQQLLLTGANVQEQGGSISGYWMWQLLLGVSRAAAYASSSGGRSRDNASTLLCEVASKFVHATKAEDLQSPPLLPEALAMLRSAQLPWQSDLQNDGSASAAQLVSAAASSPAAPSVQLSALCLALSSAPSAQRLWWELADWTHCHWKGTGAPAAAAQSVEYLACCRALSLEAQSGDTAAATPLQATHPVMMRLLRCVDTVWAVCKVSAWCSRHAIIIPCSAASRGLACLFVCSMFAWQFSQCSPTFVSMPAGLSSTREIAFLQAC